MRSPTKYLAAAVLLAELLWGAAGCSGNRNNPVSPVPFDASTNSPGTGTNPPPSTPAPLPATIRVVSTWATVGGNETKTIYAPSPSLPESLKAVFTGYIVGVGTGMDDDYSNSLVPLGGASFRASGWHGNSGSVATARLSAILVNKGTVVIRRRLVLNGKQAAAVEEAALPSDFPPNSVAVGFVGLVEENTGDDDDIEHRAQVFVRGRQFIGVAISNNGNSDSRIVYEMVVLAFPNRSLGADLTEHVLLNGQSKSIDIPGSGSSGALLAQTCYKTSPKFDDIWKQVVATVESQLGPLTPGSTIRTLSIDPTVTELAKEAIRALAEYLLNRLRAAVFGDGNDDDYAVVFRSRTDTRIVIDGKYGNPMSAQRISMLTFRTN